ncbi:MULTISPECIES: hypothetical protein [Polymorphospora]|uniref:DUF4878 domain-containing protein n=1 Tax=Polymorphospora lycopeni TaxID=3140240 RepID=A0ABV5CPX4_9ACTN
MTTPGPAGPPLPYAVPAGQGGSTVPPGGAAPAGPGVAPPFAAPPTEGRTARLWWGLGAAALAVALCCGGGAVAFVGLAVSGTQALNEQAGAVVGDYFDAVTDGDYDRAYSLLCRREQQREPILRFRTRLATEPRLTNYQVGDLEITDELEVPVDVTYAEGGSGRVWVSLAQNTGTGEFEVCGIGQ